MAQGKGFYIPSLDGIRAVAFAVVFLSHAGLGRFVPGRFGVTVFFFLSGYLITTLMRMEMAKTGTIRFGQFYLRRVLRIFPPLYISLALAIALNLLGVLPGKMELPSVLAQVFHLTNYQAIYGSSQAVPAGTVVLWSLAVEEHFYFGFPFLYWWLTTQGFTAKRQATTLLLICALTLLWRVILARGYGVDDLRTGFGTDTRIDSILFGSVMAVWYNPVLDPPILRGTVTRIVALLVGMGTLLFTFVYRDDLFRMDLRYTLQGLAMFPLFYVAIVAPDWPIIRWLNVGWVRWVGMTSYSSYLFHAVFLEMLAHLWGGFTWLGGALGLTMTLVCSALMYRWVEKPCADLRKRLHQNSAPVPAQPA